VLDGTGPRLALRSTAVLDAKVPRLTPGVEQLGEYEGSGLTEATYLVRNPGGQVVQVSRLLHLVLSGIDGERTVSEIAARATGLFGRQVSPGNVEYLLVNKLAPLGLLDSGRPPAAGPGRPGQALLGLRLRCTLVPERGVQQLARVFQPLFSPLVVGAVLGGLGTLDAWAMRGGRLPSAVRYTLLHPLVLLLVLTLSVLSMVFHECGHAAACRYGGARPGLIGMGLYIVWPAFFTNVTDAYRLGRAGRIRTDLGGVYFNAIFAAGLMAAYLSTGYSPLLVAVILIHVEIIQQLVPSLRFDGYFILADLIGVPDLFRRIGPTLRSLIPGQPADPRVQGLKRTARITLTVWVLIIVPMLALQLALVVLNGPSLARTCAHSLHLQLHALIAQFGAADIAAGLVTLLSIVMLLLPVIGLSFILLMTGRQISRLVLVLNRRHVWLRIPTVVVALALAAGLVAHWGLFRWAAGPSASSPAAAGPSLARPVASAIRLTPPILAAPGPAPVVLTPVSARGFDPLTSPWRDPSDENSYLAGYAIDHDPVTYWHSQYYLGSPEFGGLKAGSGLIVDMGRAVRLSTVTVTFGSRPGADVAIKIGNDDALAPATMSSLTTVATAGRLGGTHTFTAASSAAGRYVVIWFTKLPPIGHDRFQAQIFSIKISGTN